MTIPDVEAQEKSQDAAAADCEDVEEDDFDPAEVHRKGTEHVSRMQEIVTAQKIVHDRIMVKVKDEGKGQSVRPTSPLRPISRNSNESSNDVEAETLRLLSPKGMFNPSRLFNACHLANELSAHKASRDKFHRRKRQLLQVQADQHEALNQSLEERDLRVAICNRSRMERQAEIALHSQHKGAEQSKMRHELDKKKDREFEKLKDKHEPLALQFPVDGPPLAPIVQSESAHGILESRSLSRPNTSPSTTEGRRLSKSQSYSDVPIYKDAMESHNLYETQLTKWSSFVADNEKRAEAYWRKRMQDPELKRRRQSKAPALSTLRKSVIHVTQVQKVKKFLTRSHSMFGADDTSDWHVEGLDGLSSPGNSQVLRSSSTFSSASPQSYAARLERVKSFHLDLDLQARQKLEKNRQFNEEKRQQGRNEVGKKAGQAKEYNEGWMKRSNECSERREMLNISDDSAMNQKLADFNEQREQWQASRDEDLSSLSRSNGYKAQVARATAWDRLDATTSAFKEKIELRDEQSALFVQTKSERLVRKADSGLAEKVQQMCDKKKATERVFMRTTSEALDKKHKKNQHAKYLSKKMETEEALERHRFLRQGQPKLVRNTTDPANLLLPLPVPDEERDLTALVDEDSHDSTLSYAGVSPQSPHNIERSPFGSKDSEESPTPSKISRRSIFQSPGMDFAGTTGENPRRRSVGQRPTFEENGNDVGEQQEGGKFVDSRLPSKESFASHIDEEAQFLEGSPEEEAEFLEDLELCSQKWLKTMRKDSSV